MRPPPHPSPTNADDQRLALRRSGSLLQQHLDRLRALPAHGNTTLHADQLIKGLLLSFFDPLLRSLRLIEDCGSFGGELDLPRLARSTTSDALAAFDPAHLLPLVNDLRERVPQLDRLDLDLAGITRRIIAADGTYLTTLADVAWALRHKKSDGRTQAQVRANVQMDVASWAPQVITVSGDDDESEPAAFARDLLGGVLYVVDRNFCDFSFLSAVLAKGSDFVLRIRSNAPSVRVLESRTLTPADLEAGVLTDEIVQLSGRGAPAGLFRRVTIQSTDRSGCQQIIRLLTNLADEAIAAHVIGSAYRLRWQIELFFKWLKTWARMGHLLSTSRNGITTQLYLAVIAVLLLHIQSGHRVSIYALAALSRVARGEQSLQEAMAVIAHRERERAMNNARKAKQRARKKLA